MCDCSKIVLEKIINKMKSELTKGSVVTVNPYWDSMSLVSVNGVFTSRLSLKISGRYRKGKKDGSTSITESKLDTAVLPSYCPFCGVKYPK